MCSLHFPRLRNFNQKTLIYSGNEHKNIIEFARELIKDSDEETYDYLGQVDLVPDYHEGISNKDFEVLCGPQVPVN